MRRNFVAHREGIEAAMVGTQLLGVRAAIPARFAPPLPLLYAVGATDGFAQRAIRRARGGRESAGLYHRAKYLQVAVLGLGGVGPLLWPGPVRWAYYIGQGVRRAMVAPEDSRSAGKLIPRRSLGFLAMLL